MSSWFCGLPCEVASKSSILPLDWRICGFKLLELSKKKATTSFLELAVLSKSFLKYRQDHANIWGKAAFASSWRALLFGHDRSSKFDEQFVGHEEIMQFVLCRVCSSTRGLQTCERCHLRNRYASIMATVRVPFNPHPFISFHCSNSHANTCTNLCIFQRIRIPFI